MAKLNAAYSGLDVFNLIPQRPPIVMIDTFYGIKEGASTTGLTIREDNIFVRDGLFREPGLVEHVAQSAAARVGYVCKEENRPVPLGFIGAIKNFQFHLFPKVNDRLYTTIIIQHEVMGVSLIYAKVVSEDGETLYCEGEMKIFISEEE